MVTLSYLGFAIRSAQNMWRSYSKPVFSCVPRGSGLVSELYPWASSTSCSCKVQKATAQTFPSSWQKNCCWGTSIQIARTVLGRCADSEQLQSLRALCDVIVRPRIQVCSDRLLEVSIGLCLLYDDSVIAECNSFFYYSFLTRGQQSFSTLFYKKSYLWREIKTLSLC